MLIKMIQFMIQTLCLIFTICRYQCLKYLFSVVPTSVSTYDTRNTDNIPLLKVKHIFFQDSFFPSVVIKWSKLYQNIRNLETLKIFKKTLSKFIRPSVINSDRYIKSIN